MGVPDSGWRDPDSWVGGVLTPWLRGPDSQVGRSWPSHTPWASLSLGTQGGGGLPWPPARSTHRSHEAPGPSHSGRGAQHGPQGQECSQDDSSEEGWGRGGGAVRVPGQGSQVCKSGLEAAGLPGALKGPHLISRDVPTTPPATPHCPFPLPSTRPPALPPQAPPPTIRSPFLPPGPADRLLILSVQAQPQASCSRGSGVWGSR